MYNLKWIKKGAMLLVAFTLILALYGCKGSSDGNDYDNMIEVVYDANGGVLRNKTDIVRKLRVAKNSKIPRYVDDLQNSDEYTVPGLGQARRSGYHLVGWYLEENATYTEDPNGKYIYLDSNYQNGVYTIDPLGEYVFGYIEDEDGQYVFVYVQMPEEGVSTIGMEYIYFEGSDGYGFYIYDSDNATHAEVYETTGSFEPSKLTEIANSYVRYEDLTPEFQTLLVDLKTFRTDYYLYSEADGLAIRYSFGSGYVELSSLMIEDTQGLYVQVGLKYELYDQTKPEHVGLTRYGIDQRYKFTSTGSYETPSDLTRYNATIVHWDFAKDRVTEPIILKAHWVKKATVEFVEKTGRVISITTKRNPTNTGDINLEPGQTIGKIATIPQYYDSDTETPYTFVNWSISETEYIPWDFDNDVFPETSDTLRLYAYMIEGTYKRITSAIDLATVASDPNGNYVLVTDIDFAGKSFANSSPLGFSISTNTVDVTTPFTGEFLAMGHKISNFVLRVSNSQKEVLENSGIVVVTGLFPVTNGATIKELSVEDLTVEVSTTRSGTNVILDLGGAALIGTAIEETTKVENCYVEVTFEVIGSGILNRDVYVGDIVARGAANVTITGSTSDIDYSALIGITTGSLIEQILN